MDVNVANLPCGLNGAVYFSEMVSDGGKSKYPTNVAGAQYGTGYCDSQCPRDLKFIDGLVRCFLHRLSFQLYDEPEQCLTLRSLLCLGQQRRLDPGL